ncbi:MAG: hypothetical protein H7145_16750 [Akkermansiaceae bacterium]|nr:hypothetical protein [Armatimonadota bacterium]
MGEIQWIPQTRVALVTLGRYSLPDETNTLSLMRVDTVAGTVRRVVGLEMASSVEVSPSQPLVYIRTRAVKGENGQPGTSPYLQVYTPQGLGRVIRFDEGTGQLRWMLDGKSVYATRFNERSSEGKRTNRDLLTVIDLQTGEITHPEKLPTVRDNEGTPPPYAEWSVGPETTRVTVPGPFGQGQDTTALWLRGRQVAAPQTKSDNGGADASPAPVSGAFRADALLVATNIEVKGYLRNQTTAAILFLRDGSLCAAPVFRLPRTAFEQGIRGVQQRMTMSNAKQVGLAILQYAQDYDEYYPMPGKGVAKVLQPYIKSEELFKNPATGEPGFIYTHSGPTAIAQIENESDTQLGYISGPGGRAIIWADGHVTWQDM